MWLKRSAGLALLAAAAALGCSANGKEKQPEKAAPAAARAPVAVEVVTVEGQDLAQGIDVVGTLAPKFEATVKSEVPGRIAEVLVTQWVAVAKGQPLARVDARELEASLERAKAGLEAARASAEVAKAGVLEAKVAADRAEREHERLKKLKEAGLATQQSLDDSLTARDAARARIASAEAQVRASLAQIGTAQEDVRQVETRLAKTVIRSPLKGVVSERNVNVGDLPGDAVAFRIVDNSLLDLTVTVPSRDSASVRPGQALTFTTDAFPGEVFSGRVMFVNPSVDPADRSVKVVAEVKNLPTRLRGGLFVKGWISTGLRKGVLQVPRQALLTWDMAAGRAEVFVVQGSSARRRAVDTGTASGDRVEVTSGLERGDKVVVRGAFNLKDADLVQASVAPARR